MRTKRGDNVTQLFNLFLKLCYCAGLFICSWIFNFSTCFFLSPILNSIVGFTFTATAQSRLLKSFIFIAPGSCNVCAKKPSRFSVNSMFAVRSCGANVFKCYALFLLPPLFHMMWTSTSLYLLLLLTLLLLERCCSFLYFLVLLLQTLFSIYYQG